VCKVPAAGGPVVKVADVDGNNAFESADGKFLYYMRYAMADVRLSGIYRIPTGVGQPEHVLDALYDAIWPVDDGIYFVPKPDASLEYSIQFFHAASKNVQTIATFKKQIRDLTVSPDRRWILYTQMEQSGGDLMLVENFR
jgi:hypothetical protein